MSNQKVTETPGHLSPPCRRQLVRYFLILIAIPAVFYVPPVFLVRLPSYSHWSGFADSPTLNYAFEAAGQNADVVIYGDSSANHAIDPRQMSAALGVSVVDLPSNLSVLLVDDDLPLRHYMEADRPPKVIVLYLAAWDLDYRHMDINSNPLYTGLDILGRYGTSKEIYSFIKAHPTMALQFPFMFYPANFGVDGLLHRGLLRQRAIEVVATKGYAALVVGSHATSSCVIPIGLIDRIGFDGIGQLIKKYSTPRTKVLVYVASVPSCTNAQAVVDRARQVLPTAPPKIMPASLFVDDNYYVHLFAEGVPQATSNLIEAVRPFLDSSEPKTTNLAVVSDVSELRAKSIGEKSSAAHE
jgi:hypothetical protein